MANNTQSYSSSNGWKLTGNSGILTTDFLGTLNAADLVFKRFNIEGLRLATGGALLATGDQTTGVTPSSGTGIKMMWIPQKQAFRAGYVSSNQWDAANIGIGSFATGIDTIASGARSISLGRGSIVLGDDSVGIGYGNNIPGYNSMIIGAGNYVTSHDMYVIGDSNNITSGTNAGTGVCIGAGNSITSGQGAIIIGSTNTVGALGATAIGRNIIINSTYAAGIGNYLHSNNFTGGLLLGDASTLVATTYLFADVNDQFKSRFAGGYKFNIDNTTTAVDIAASTGAVTVNNLVGTGVRPVFANASGTLQTKLHQNRYIQQGTFSGAATVTGQQSLMSTGTGSNIIPASGFLPGDAIRVRMGGNFQPGTSNINATIRVSFGGTILATQTVTIPSAYVVSQTVGYNIEFVLSANGTPSSASVYIDGALGIKDLSNQVNRNYYDLINTGTTINLTNANTLDVTIQWSATSGFASFVNYSTIIELIKT